MPKWRALTGILGIVAWSAAAAGATIEKVRVKERKILVALGEGETLTKGAEIELRLGETENYVAGTVMSLRQGKAALTLSSCPDLVRTGMDVTLINRDKDLPDRPQASPAGEVRRISRAKARIQVDFPDVDVTGLPFDDFRLVKEDGTEVSGRIVRIQGKRSRVTFLVDVKSLDAIVAGEQVTLRIGGDDQPEASAGLRTRHVYLGAGGGAIFGAIPGYALSLGMVLGDRVEIGLDYMAGSTSADAVNGGTTQSNSLNVGATLALLHLRYFVYRSFDIGIAGGRAAIHGYTHLNDSDSGSEADLDVRTTSVIGGLTLGNEWVLAGGFTLTIDWLGIYAPYSWQTTTTSSNDAPTTGATSDVAQQVTHRVVGLGSQRTFQAVIRLGWSL